MGWAAEARVRVLCVCACVCACAWQSRVSDGGMAKQIHAQGAAARTRGLGMCGRRSRAVYATRSCAVGAARVRCTPLARVRFTPLARVWFTPLARVWFTPLARVWFTPLAPVGLEEVEDGQQMSVVRREQLADLSAAGGVGRHTRKLGERDDGSRDGLHVAGRQCQADW